MTTDTLIIGLGHYSRVGKDTFADAFVNYTKTHYPRLKVVKRSLASVLKAVCYDMFSWAGLKAEEYYNQPDNEASRHLGLSELYDLTPVNIWCTVGAQIRDKIHKDVWINALFHRLISDNYDIVIIPDVRYLNEVQAIRDHDGLLIKIIRPGVKPLNTEADQSLVHAKVWDFVFGATGRLENLVYSAENFAETQCRSRLRKKICRTKQGAQCVK